MTHITAQNGNRTPVFFERALNHCYYQTEQLLQCISSTPHRYRKTLNKQKYKLQHEAKFLESKLNGYKR